jgi:CO/xanthine dehydrogenase Mo-binding subunit
MSAERIDKYKIIGESIPRLDAREKVTGSALYLNDIVLPNMLYGKVLRSPIPHGRILKIDTSRAEKLPGVRAVITSADLPDARFGSYIQSIPVLAREKVRFIGEPVAAVAAVDEETALEALELIDVEYEELVPIFDTDFAMSPEAPIIHEDFKSYIKAVEAVHFGNVCTYITMEEGNVQENFNKSDYIFEDVFTTPRQHQTPLETCGAIASFDDSGNLTLWTPTQGAHVTQIHLNQGLLIPMNKIRVIATTVGGGFGSRVEAKAQPVAAALAQKARKPVKLLFTRKEEFVTNTPRHPSKTVIKTGLSKDGKILARQLKMVIDSGAYADHGPGVINFALVFANGPYRTPAYKLEGYAVNTNNITCGAFRGFGNPQATFARESHMDMIAERLGLNPIEFRLKNVVENGDIFIGKTKMPSVGIRETLEKASKEANWGKKRKKGRGIGVSCFSHCSGMFASTATVSINQDGTVMLATAANEIGQGSSTILRQIASEELNIPLKKIGLAHADTNQNTYSWGAGGSRTTRTTGNAVRLAAADAKRKLFDLASKVLETNPDELVFDGEKFSIKEKPYQALTLDQIGAISNWVMNGPIVGNGVSFVDPFEYDKEKLVGLTCVSISGIVFGTHIVEVEVDEDTGKVEVINAVAAHDVGKAINPMLVEGQIEGGISQGLGYGLFEDLVCKNGVVLNDSFLDYKIATAVDMPNTKVIIVEENDPEGPFGAKGVGEAPMIATAAAVANAVNNAVGARVTDLPLNMERVWEAINKKS